MQHVGSKNIKVEYKLSIREIKKVNEKCNLGLALMIHLMLTIIFCQSRANGMMSGMIRNFISREANFVSKIY